MDKELVVLVDQDDRQIGTMEKIEAHSTAVLHRAFQFSLLIKIKNYFFSSGRLINIIHLAYGLIPVAVTREMGRQH